jgi:hypothetical protein
MTDQHTNGTQEERDEVLKELDKLEERLAKLRVKEQELVDEEAFIGARIAKLQKQVKTLSDEDLATKMEWVLSLRPLQAPLFLSLCLGKARFFLPDPQRLLYKEEYEKVKLKNAWLLFAISVTRLFYSSLFTDALAYFHLLYYYSMLILREQIMVVNGSRNRFWLQLHHYLGAMINGVLLICPNDTARQSMRNPLLHFAIYFSAVQVLQYRYQMRRLDRLRALNRVCSRERTTRSATIDSKNDFSFLLPFILSLYGWQFWLARRFWDFAGGSTWHARTLAALFLMLGSGNLMAVIYSLIDKQ